MVAAVDRVQGVVEDDMSMSMPVTCCAWIRPSDVRVVFFALDANEYGVG